MPDITQVDRYQWVVLWPFAGYDNFGQPTVSDDPVEMRAAWLDKRSERLDKQGNTIMVDVTAIVGIDIDIGSVMWQGRLHDLAGTDGPGEDVYEVKTFNKTPDERGRFYARDVGLMRYKRKLPGFG